MGGGGKVKVGYWYRLGWHCVLCQGGADEILRIKYADRVAWEGSISTNQTLNINKPDLLGGEKREGGWVGAVDFLFGGETQGPSDYLAYHTNRGVIPSYLNTFATSGEADGFAAAAAAAGKTTNQLLAENGGIPVPAYRGVVSLLFKSFRFAAMNPYMKDMSVTVRRVPKTLNTTHATIIIDGRYHANPAHIIYETLTNTIWGLGFGVDDIDVTSFTAAAATLYAEGFGLSLAWTDEATADDFINLILSHISATLYPDPATGKFTLKLIRSDYTVGSLLELNESNILAFRSDQRAGNNDLTNELTVEWYDPDNEKTAKLTVQNLATLYSVGQAVRRVVQYLGIRNAPLAARVAQRDLIAFSTPLAKLSLDVNLQAWNLRPGSCFKLNWPKRGINGVVFRVIDMEYGNASNNRISINAIEDVYGMPASAYVASTPSSWAPIPAGLVNLTDYVLAEMPYYVLIKTLGEDYASKLDDGRNFIMAGAYRSNSAWIDFGMYEKVGTDYFSRDSGKFSPFVKTDASITELQTSVTYGSYYDLSSVVVGDIAAIGTELVSVDAINTTTKTLTLKRGVLDTIPVTHAANSVIFILGSNFAADLDTTRFAGESVTYKLVPSTASESLALASATAHAITLVGRQGKPYPPANVKINTSYFPTTVTGTISVTYAHRDRTAQTVSPVAWTSGSVGPESTVRYAVKFYNASNALLVQKLDMSGASFSAVLNYTGNVMMVFSTINDNGESAQKFQHTFAYTPPGGTTSSSITASTYVAPSSSVVLDGGVVAP